MKKLLLILPVFLFAFTPVIAEESEPAEEIIIAEETEVIADAIQAEPTISARATAAQKRNIGAAARVSMVGAGIRSTTQIAAPIVIAAAVTEEVDPDLECSTGEYPKGKKCVQCDEKNNPGIKWTDPGRSCKATCTSDDYILVGEDKDQPKCEKKCDVWGGTASRTWNREAAEFSFCGSGDSLKCVNGFYKTWEQTGASGTEAGHCMLEETMSGKCAKDGQMKPGKFPNGRCMQTCENGFWTGCTLSRFCEAGFHEDNYKDVIFIKDKKDAKATAFECVQD